MNNCAVLATKARQQSNQSEVALTATLLELLTVAQSKVEVDRQAAQACLSRATALLVASLERDVGPKARERIPRRTAALAGETLDNFHRGESRTAYQES